MVSVKFRITSELVEIDGLERLTLLRYGHFAMLLEALTACGAFSFYLYRYWIFLPCSFQSSFSPVYSSDVVFKLGDFEKGYDYCCLEWHGPAQFYLYF